MNSSWGLRRTTCKDFSYGNTRELTSGDKFCDTQCYGDWYDGALLGGRVSPGPRGEPGDDLVNICYVHKLELFFKKKLKLDSVNIYDTALKLHSSVMCERE